MRLPRVLPGRNGNGTAAAAGMPVLIRHDEMDARFRRVCAVFGDGRCAVAEGYGLDSQLRTALKRLQRDGAIPAGLREESASLEEIAAYWNDAEASARPVDESAIPRRLRALVERLASPAGSSALRARLFETLWDNLRYVGELGSLVQVRESVTRVLDDWVDAEARSRGITRILQPAHEQQLELGDLLTQAARARAQQLELERTALEEEAAKLRRELLTAVEEAAADIADDPEDRLFAEDTARGLKLVQLLSRRYDIAVMNPPYGHFVPRPAIKDFVEKAYRLTSNNIYAAFIDRACQLTQPEGYVGALVSSTFKNLKSFEKLRTEILLKRNPLILMVDLGGGILDDAKVQVAAIALRGGAP